MNNSLLFCAFCGRHKVVCKYVSSIVNGIICDKCLEEKYEEIYYEKGKDINYNSPEKTGPSGNYCSKHKENELFWYDGEEYCPKCEDEERKFHTFTSS